MADLVRSPNPFVADAGADERVLFIRQTYTHVAGAWLAFFLFECLLLKLPATYTFTALVLMIPFGWMAVLGLFMGVAWIARVLVNGGLSRSMQYTGLALYVLAEAVVFA